MTAILPNSAQNTKLKHLEFGHVAEADVDIDTLARATEIIPEIRITLVYWNPTLYLKENRN